MRFQNTLCGLIFSAGLIFTSLPSCVGYQLGNTKHQKLLHIENVYVPLVLDETQEIRLASQATNQIVKAISQDGSFKITGSSDAHATLNAVIKTLTYTEFRSNRLDTLLSEELIMKVTIQWNLEDNTGKILEEGQSTGTTRFVADSNQRLSRDNAKNDALQKVAQKITSRIANGF